MGIKGIVKWTCLNKAGHQQLLVVIIIILSLSRSTQLSLIVKTQELEIGMEIGPIPHVINWWLNNARRLFFSKLYNFKMVFVLVLFSLLFQLCEQTNEISLFVIHCANKPIILHHRIYLVLFPLTSQFVCLFVCCSVFFLFRSDFYQFLNFCISILSLWQIHSQR